MRSMWENVAERVYETDVALGVSRHNTNLIGPEEPGEQRETKKRPTTAVIEEMEVIDREHRDGWKPLSLSTPMLAAVIALTLLIAAAIETLAQRSKAQGALALSTSADKIPMYAQLGALYLPIIAAVIYSMVWSLVDLDAKRMQPWFQLSREKAPTAKNSLFLDYQYEFVGTVPWQSGKRRHWPAFFAGTAMVLVFWVITPFQSTIMGTGTVKQTEPVTIGTRSALVSMDKQRLLLGPAAINTAYAVAWLNQPYPAFTTSTYALLPFYVKDDPSPADTKSNWTATTTKLWTDLDCQFAKVEDFSPGNQTSIATFSNGQGCNVSTYVFRDSDITLSYYGYYYGSRNTRSFSTPACPPTVNSTHQFFAQWTGPKKAENNQPANSTTMFCQPSYYSQKVLATVDAETLVPDPDSIQELEPQKTLSESDFNSTTFEYVISIGTTDRKGLSRVSADPPASTSAAQWRRLRDRGFLIDSVALEDNMVGFGMAATNLSVEAYSDPKVMRSAFKIAHQSLFSLAIQSLLTNDTSFSNETASVEFELHGIIVSRRFSAIVEGFLCLVALFTGFLLWFCRTSPSKLNTNPSSINRYMDLFRYSPELLDLFRPMDTTSEKKLKNKLGKDEIKMTHDDEDGRIKFLIFQDTLNSQNPKPSGNAHGPHDSQHSQHSEDSTEQQGSASKGLYKPKRPLALRRSSGALFVAILIAAIVVLCYFKAKEQSLGGLPRPSNNFEVLQILENYIPTIFATLVEPFWLLLTRLVCVLQPFRDLSQGKAKASSSIDATYTSIPPQLVFWRALKSRHFTLMLLCSMSMIANILAVGLGSLFNERSTVVEYRESIPPTFAPQLIKDGQPYLNWLRNNWFYQSWSDDHFYIAWANMSTDTTLPPWVSQDYYFQQYNLSESSKAGDTYTFQTVGFGANANCTAAGSFEVPIKATPSDNKTCHLIEEVGTGMRTSMFTAGYSGTGTLSAGSSAIEYLTSTTCDIPLVVGWGRTPNGTDSNSTMGASLVTCYPIMETAKFNLTVDSDGYVLSYNRTGDLESPAYADSKNVTVKLLAHLSHTFTPSGTYGHNDTIAQDWLNYFITLRLNSRDSLDPQLSAPDPKKMVPVIEDVYRRNFAILLSLGYEDLFDNKTGDPIQATRSSAETRIFMEPVSFYIAVVILGINAIAAVIFYARPTEFNLPRLPTTLGSLIAYIASSRLASPSYKQIPGRDARTYSFGRFQGADGKMHVGIEMDPHVVPIDLASLVKKPGVFHRLRQFFTSSSPPSSK